MSAIGKRGLAPRSLPGVGGFTLVELCFTVTVLGLIAGIGWPSLHAMAQTLKTRSQAAAFAQQLNALRERAVMGGTTENVASPTGSDIQSSGREAILLPDGSARPLRVVFGKDKAQIAVNLDETGHVRIESL